MCVCVCVCVCVSMSMGCNVVLFTSPFSFFLPPFFLSFSTTAVVTSVLAPVKTLLRATEVRQRAATFWVRVSGAVSKLGARERNEKDAMYCLGGRMGLETKKRGEERVDCFPSFPSVDSAAATCLFVCVCVCLRIKVATLSLETMVQVRKRFPVLLPQQSFLYLPAIPAILCPCQCRYW
jgi:hypothetical protein